MSSTVGFTAYLGCFIFSPPPPAYLCVDIQDTRVVFGDFAYGGTTALSLVKLDAQAVANRMEIGEGS